MRTCGKNMGNDLLLIPCDLPSGHEGPCERNIWPVTAREDQPQLGTCKFWPLLQHAQNVCCVDWKPVTTEDQPRPTPDVEVYRKLLMERFADRCSMEQIASAAYILAGEAQGEAPQDWKWLYENERAKMPQIIEMLQENTKVMLKQSKLIDELTRELVETSSGSIPANERGTVAHSCQCNS